MMFHTIHQHSVCNTQAQDTSHLFTCTVAHAHKTDGFRFVEELGGNVVKYFLDMNTNN